ncbi:MAG: hypothetical protein MUQ94_10125, partial [Burkholderiaceae bacterium]|nr:hypothetical protein [Burkholderiaceae bacterium]
FPVTTVLNCKNPDRVFVTLRNLTFVDLLHIFANTMPLTARFEISKSILKSVTLALGSRGGLPTKRTS